MAGILSMDANNIQRPSQVFSPYRNNNLKTEETGKTKTFTMDVVTLNTWLLTTPLPIGKNIEARKTRISKAIRGYDLVGIQEAFLDGSKRIAKEDKDEYPYQYRQVKEKNLSNSGLTTFSKLEISERDFKPFSFSSGTDSLAQKGIVFTRLKAPGFGYLDVYNTHYQAGSGFDDKKWYNPFYHLIPSYTNKISKHDIKLTHNMDFENFFKAHDKGYTSIFMGDFNSTEDGDVYADLVKRLGLKDSFREANPNDPGYTADGPANPYKPDDGQSRIDYIFYHPGKNQQVDVLNSRVTFNTPVDGLFLSDHFGVETKFRITDKN
jgi:endonuclease/exonuclease/phosphatase family metal-dependent hydrolase